MSKVFNLIRYLNVDSDTFYSLLRKKDSEKYKSFIIQKRNGRKRLIEAPIDNDLIVIQNRIKILLEKIYIRHKPQGVHGYLPSESILTNAQELTQNGFGKIILKIDLRDFFNSITYERVFGMLKKAFTEISDESANAICLLVTCNRHVPQGASTSPIISNMICKRMDKQLMRFAKSIGGIYTRYADDIFFSFSNEDNAIKAIEGDSLKKPIIPNKTLERIINSNGFAINYNKVKLLSKNNSQNVCGIIVNSMLNARREFIRDLRVKIHKYGQGEKINKQSIVGRLSFLRNVRGLNDELACKYCSVFNKMTVPPFPDADFRLGIKSAIKHYIVRIDLDNGYYGTGFFSRGWLITSEHVVEHKETGEIIDYSKTRPGYYKTVTIKYYDSSGKLQSLQTSVIEAKTNNGVAFLKIDKYDLFFNRELKVQNNEYDYEKNEVLIAGSQSSSSRTIGLNSKKASIIGTSHLYGCDVYLINRGIIYHGMSGCPLFDSKTFRVVGVSLSGQIDEKDDQENSCSIINNGSFKSSIRWEPDEIWKETHKEW